MSDEIDFVVLWVDSNDEEWQKDYLYYRNIENNNNHGVSLTRFRDWDNLQYWFRAIEENCPWVRKIHFVTCGHYPEWLNKNNSKLNLVKHSDIIKSSYLPTFNSHAIELNIHRIEGLSEKFVYFNDDFFINKPLEKDFFFIENKPCDFFVMESLRGRYLDDFFGCIVYRDMCFINKHYEKKVVLKNNFNKVYNFKYGKFNLVNLINRIHTQFSYFRTPHLPQSFLKESFIDVWKKEPAILESVTSNKFRKPDDLNQYVVKYNQLVTGNFSPCSPFNRGRYFNINSTSISMIKNDIASALSPMICLNDGNDIDVIKYKNDINSSFGKRYPYKSTFESV